MFTVYKFEEPIQRLRDFPFTILSFLTGKICLFSHGNE